MGFTIIGVFILGLWYQGFSGVVVGVFIHAVLFCVGFQCIKTIYSLSELGHSTVSFSTQHRFIISLHISIMSSDSGISSTVSEYPPEPTGSYVYKLASGIPDPLGDQPPGLSQVCNPLAFNVVVSYMKHHINTYAGNTCSSNI